MGRTSNSKHRLLNAASELLWEKSYHSVTVDEICARAGTQKASLYYFFDSKAALTYAALEHFWQEVAKPAYETYFSPSYPPLVRITNFLIWLQELQREKYREIKRVPGWPFFTLGCELGTHELLISEVLFKIEADEVRYFESAICDALDQNIIEQIDPRLEALSFRAAMEGLLARARILNDPDELSALTKLPASILRIKPPGAATVPPRTRRYRGRISMKETPGNEPECQPSPRTSTCLTEINH